MRGGVSKARTAVLTLNQYLRTKSVRATIAITPLSSAIRT